MIGIKVAFYLHAIIMCPLCYITMQWLQKILIIMCLQETAYGQCVSEGPTDVQWSGVLTPDPWTVHDDHPSWQPYRLVCPGQ